MIITRVTALALKGRDFSYALAPAQAIIGPNFAGKTAILEAIRICLIGYLPEVGKLPKASWELSSGSEMTVRVDFDNDAIFSRRFYLSGTTVKEEVIKEVAGLESIPLLDSARYFGMTDSERTAYVFSMIKLPDTYTREAIIAECERLSFEEKHTDQVQIAKADCLEDVRDSFEGADVRGGDPSLSSANPSIQEALTIAIELFKERYTHWNKRAKDTQGAVTTMAELKLRETTVFAAAQGVSEQIEKAHTAIEDLKAKKGKLEARQEEAERVAMRAAVINKLLTTEVRDYATAIKNLQDRAALIKLDPTVLEKGARVNLVESIRITKVDHGLLRSQVSEQDRILDTANDSLSQLEKLTCCPYCKSKGKDWRATLAGQLAATIERATTTRDEAKTSMEAMGKRLEELEASLAVSDERARKNINRQLDIDTCARNIEGLEREKASDDARRAELRGELEELKKRPVAEDLTASIKQHDIGIRTVRDDLAVLEEKQKAETQLKQDLKRAAEAEIEHLNAKAHVLVIKGIANLLKEKREAMITEAFTGLLVTANKVAGGILKAPLALHDNTVGMWNGAKFIPHRVFSGTEKALTYIAIATALSAQAPLKLVILDEFGRLDEGNQLAVARSLLVCMKEAIIDQFILVGTSLPKALAEGYGLPPGDKVEVLTLKP